MNVVKTFYAENELRNFSYLVLDEATGDSWVIDPYEAGPIIQFIRAQGLNLKGILNTHQHFDHVRGNAPLLETFGPEVVKLSNSQKIQINDKFSLECLDTPGHTMDHQVFIWKDLERPVALFSGDTLFNSGVGNCRGGGDVNLLFETTNKLISTLPEETLLYPGHDYRRRNLEFALSVEPDNNEIKEQLKKVNSFDTTTQPPNSLRAELAVNPFLKADKESFIKLRTLRDNW